MVTDGLGARRSAKDRDGLDVDHLDIRKELAGVPSFEFALRERVSRLAAFRHPSYARVRAVERSGNPETPLTVVSDHTPGRRLSELLAAAETAGVVVDTGTALCLIRQLVPAIAILQETARDASHGAIAPERLIVTLQGRLVVAEYVLGSALEQLLYPRDRYWLQLRVPLPRVAGLARFDHLADVAQIGVVALALVLGRRLKDEEFPARLAELVATATWRSVEGDEEPLSPSLTRWLERALQLDPRQSFPTAVEARTALDRAVEEAGYAAPPAALDAFLARVAGGVRPTAPPVASRPAVPARPPTLEPAANTGAVAVPPVVFPPASSVAASAEARGIAAGLTQTQLVTAGNPAAMVSAALASAPGGPVATAASSTSQAPLSPAVATASPAPVPPRTPAPRESAVPPALRAEPTGRKTLSPTSILASTDEDATEVPLEFPAAATRGTGRAVLGAALAAALMVGSAATFAGRQFFAKPKAPTVDAGSLSVTTNPPGAQLLVDGAAHGTSPGTIDLPPGPHTLVVKGAYGLREVPITITAGTKVAQFLDLPQPAPEAPSLPDPAPAPEPEVPAAAAEGPVGGWISVAGRFDLQVFEGGKLLGSNQSDRIMVAAGAHELELVNDELGYRTTRKLNVAPGKTASIAVEIPQGTLALNALPWADVTIDGESRGETPIGNVALPIGQHEVIFRHPELGEQRHTIAVTLKAPARLSVDLRKR